MKQRTLVLNGVIIVLCACLIALGLGFYSVWRNKAGVVSGHNEGSQTATSPGAQASGEVAVLEQRAQDGVASDSELVRLADMYFQVGRYDDSYALYQKVLSKSPKTISAFQGLGNITRYRGKYDESERAFKAAIALDPSNAFLYVDLGKLYRNWNKYREAEAAFKQALILDPKNDTLYSYGLGYLYRDEGKLDLAVQSFEKAVELNPKNDFNYMGLGDIYRDTGEFEKSEMNFKKALAMNPKSESYLGLGYLYLKQERLAESERAFQDYIHFIKPKAEVYSGLGYIYERQQQYEKAEQMFRKSAELNPTLGGWESLAELFDRQNRTIDATRAREEGEKARRQQGMKL